MFNIHAKAESLVIDVSDPHVAYDELNLADKIHASGIFREQANCEAHHHPPPVRDLILVSPSKHPAPTQ